MSYKTVPEKNYEVHTKYSSSAAFVNTRHEKLDLL